jgi:hypothetical protein
LICGVACAIRPSPPSGVSDAATVTDVIVVWFG